jgi:hypothetical protein
VGDERRTRIDAWPYRSVAGVLRDAELELQMLTGFADGRLAQAEVGAGEAHELGETCVMHGRDVCLSLAEPK